MVDVHCLRTGINGDRVERLSGCCRCDPFASRARHLAYLGNISAVILRSLPRGHRARLVPWLSLDDAEVFSMFREWQSNTAWSEGMMFVVYPGLWPKRRRFDVYAF